MPLYKMQNDRKTNPLNGFLSCTANLSLLIIPYYVKIKGGQKLSAMSVVMSPWGMWIETLLYYIAPKSACVPAAVRAAQSELLIHSKICGKKIGNYKTLLKEEALSILFLISPKSADRFPFGKRFLRVNLERRLRGIAFFALPFCFPH